MKRGTPGSYVLVVELAEERAIEVGRLGSIVFAPGCYCYCGSALSGLQARLARHARTEEKLHWHIDYLLAVAPYSEAWLVPGRARLECSAQVALVELGGIVVSHFGSSDCRCPGHLLRFESSPVFEDFVHRLRRLQSGAPSAERWQPVSSRR